MAMMSWFKIVAMCLAPALIIFLCAGVISIYTNVLTWFKTKYGEIDHEL